MHYDADVAILRLDLGERIALNAEDLNTPYASFLTEIEPTLA